MNQTNNNTEQVAGVANLKQREPLHSVTIRNQFSFLWKICVIYGICYLLFGYRNYDGIGVGIFTAISAVFVLLIARKLQGKSVDGERTVTIQKMSVFYLIMAVVLGFGNCMTDNAFFLLFNHVGSVLLFSVASIKMVYDDRKWDFDKYIGSLFSFLFQMMEMIPVPLRDIKVYHRDSKKKKSPNTRYVLIGIAIGLPLLFVIIPLLSSADQVFSDLIGKIFNFEKMFEWLYEDFAQNLFLGTLSFLFFALLLYLIFVTLCKGDLKEEVKECAKFSTVIAVTIFAMVDVVYVLFSGIQFLYLFVGLPSGHEYAAYAREGFFELLFVAIINFILVLFCNKYFSKNIALKVLMTVTCGCTYVMIASSAYRMFMYIKVYHLTFLRVLVLWFLVVLSLFMAGSIISIYKENWNAFRYCLFVMTCCYTVFAIGNVEGRIADYNVAQFEEALQKVEKQQKEDKEFLGKVPQLEHYLPDDYMDSKAYAPVLAELSEGYGRVLGKSNTSLIHDYFDFEKHFFGNYYEEREIDYDEDGQIGEEFELEESTAIYDNEKKDNVFMWKHFNFVENRCYINCKAAKGKME